MRRRAFLNVVGALSLSACHKGGAQVAGNKVKPLVQRPIIIAHRGLSGEWPEHTLEGYRAAITAGADYIEPDLVLTKDAVLVARHENEISETTDISQRPEFADRKATKIIDGIEIGGWFTEDLTLAELKSLRAKERLPALRGTTHDGQFEVPTFAEILTLLTQVNGGRTAPIGVYPETKHPSYFASLGLSHTEPLLKTLAMFGMNKADSPVFIQSFEVGNLQALAKLSPLPLVQLMDKDGGPFDRPDLSYAQMATSTGLKEIATYTKGIGPNKMMVIAHNTRGELSSPTSLVTDAHALGLQVHPWTFRRENFFLPTMYKNGVDPRATGDLAAEIQAYLDAGVDGIFTDNTPEASAVIRRT